MGAIAAAGGGGFVAHVSKNGGTLGVDLVESGDKAHLIVVGIKTTGAINAFNTSWGRKDTEKIEVGDCIPQVNKVIGEGMMEELKKKSNLQIQVRKCGELTVRVPKTGKLGLDMVF